MKFNNFFVQSIKRGSKQKRAELVGVSDRFSKSSDLIASRFGNMPGWAGNEPRVFWSIAFDAERRGGSVARMYEISLPKELDTAQNLLLSEKIINVLTVNKPYQAEILTTTDKVNGGMHEQARKLRLTISDRMDDGIERTPAMTFARYNAEHPERGGRRKATGGLPPEAMGRELTVTRQKVDDLRNQALKQAGISTSMASAVSRLPAQASVEPPVDVRATVQNRMPLSTAAAAYRPLTAFDSGVPFATGLPQTDEVFFIA